MRWASCPLTAAAAPVNPSGIPVAYHGGPVMRNVTIHTVFWAPAGYHFDGAPARGHCSATGR